MRSAKKPKARKLYFAARDLPTDLEVDSYTEPDVAFVREADAQAHADALNVELRALTNPFANDSDPDELMRGGETAFKKLLAKLKLPAFSASDWAAWWDAHYFDMTDAQRNAIWDALTKFPWYLVRETTLEG